MLKKCLGCAFLASFMSLAVDAKEDAPKLVLQITIDALRGDLVNRYRHVLGEDGFQRFLQQGIHYDNAHYQHANTETIVGHVSLATGAIPACHGMIANAWYDRSLGRLVYNIEDAQYRLLSRGADVDKSTEIDPTQKAAKVEGRSPATLLTSTFSDELAIHYAGQAKIFAVSVKDRGAVSMAGHAGKAFWFSKAKGEFVSSSYYYDRYPQWVEDWNQRHPAQRYAGQQWQLSLPENQYQTADDKPYETDFPGWGQTFPHAYGKQDDKYFTTRLTLGPAGDELTLDFAKQLIEHEQLGKDDIPDYLALSFSTTDYVGHLFGASSRETEENLARVDRVLAHLFEYIDDHIGLENTLVVLSADHGQPEAPGYLQEVGIKNARYFNIDDVENSDVLIKLKQKLGIKESLIEGYFHPYLNLNPRAIAKTGLQSIEVEHAVVDALVKLDGIAYAFARSDLSSGRLPETQITRSVLNNFQAQRSGDIHLVFEPDVFINDFDGLTVASAHGSVWQYDTYVPIMFLIPDSESAVIYRSVTPYAIAPTLSHYLGIKSPSCATDSLLYEVLQ